MFCNVHISSVVHVDYVYLLFVCIQMVCTQNSLQIKVCENIEGQL